MAKFKGKKSARPAAPARSAPPNLQNTNNQPRHVVSKTRRINVERAPSNSSVQPEQKGVDENYSSSIGSPSTIRNIKLDFADSRSNTIQTSPMREFMSDRNKAFEMRAANGNNTIKEQSEGGSGSKPSSLKRLASQNYGGTGSQQNIVSPKGGNNIIEEHMEGGNKPASLKRLASQTLGGSQQNVK